MFSLIGPARIVDEWTSTLRLDEAHYRWNPRRTGRPGNCLSAADEPNASSFGVPCMGDAEPQGSVPPSYRGEGEGWRVSAT